MSKQIKINSNSIHLHLGCGEKYLDGFVYVDLNNYPHIDHISSINRLEFVEVDFENFQCFWLAREALKEGGVQPTVLNAANEVAVSGFLDNRISFNQIPVVVEDCLSKGLAGDLMSVDAVCEIDKTARRIAETFIERY